MSAQITLTDRSPTRVREDVLSEQAAETTRLQALTTGMVGLLTIQLVIGYEWLVSGLTKLWRGGFAAGLGEELLEKSEGVSGWYRSFLDDVVIPNAWGFGWFVLAAELAVGVALLGTATVFLVRRDRLALSTRQVLLVVTAVAALGGILMNLSFHLANSSAHPWLIPKDGFDEGVDLDSLMPLVQLAFVVVATKVYLLGRKARRSAA